MAEGRLAGRIAVVTGAAQGIGRGCSLRFAREGATVVALDLDAVALGTLVDDAAAEGLLIEALAAADLTVPAIAQARMAEVGERHGRVDILVNAAAFAVFAWIEELTPEAWQRTLRCELDVVFLPTRAAWQLLKQSGSASVINFASANAYHALEGSPALAHCAGKGGVLAMTRQLAMEGAPHGIRANSIAPGFILTAATARHLEADPGVREKVLAKNMIKRLGQPEDIAACATWLASTEAGYVTGTDISVDGGATAW